MYTGVPMEPPEIKFNLRSFYHFPDQPQNPIFSWKEMMIDKVFRKYKVNLNDRLGTDRDLHF